MASIKYLVKGLLNLIGFDLIKFKNNQVEAYLNPNLRYDFNEEAFPLIKIIRDNSMMPYVNLVTLFELIKYCEEAKIQGDFVECGVWKGGAVGLMALTNLKYSDKRRMIHLFDAFDDICEPDPEKDGAKAVEDVRKLTNRKNIQLNGELKPIKGIYDKFGGFGSLNENRNLLEKKIAYPAEYLKYHKGWFQKTVPIDSREIDKIAVLRLDGDWYESTRVCISHLYEKVQSGGVIIIDDYGTYDGCRKAIDEFFEERNMRVFLSYSSTDCRYWIKR